MQWLNLFVAMNSYLGCLSACSKLHVPNESSHCIWFVFREELAEVSPQNCTSGLPFSDYWKLKFVCVCVFPWVSRCLRYQRPCLVSEQFRPSQLCGTCIWKGRKMFYISLTKQGSPVPFFSRSCLNFQPLLLFLLLYQPFFVCSLCWKLLWATFTLGVFMEERRGWYPDVNVCFSLGS